MGHRLLISFYEIAAFVLSQLLNVRTTKNSPTTSELATTRVALYPGLILVVAWMICLSTVVAVQKEPT